MLWISFLLLGYYVVSRLVSHFIDGLVENLQAGIMDVLEKGPATAVEIIQGMWSGRGRGVTFLARPLLHHSLNRLVIEGLIEPATKWNDERLAFEEGYILCN